MGKATHALAFTAGCATGFMALAVMFASTFWRTCENTRESGFECSACGSRTDYEPIVPFRFCPICGAAVLRKEDV